jgi:hypothetical protein
MTTTIRIVSNPKARIAARQSGENRRLTSLDTAMRPASLPAGACED